MLFILQLHNLHTLIIMASIQISNEKAMKFHTKMWEDLIQCVFFLE